MTIGRCLSVNYRQQRDKFPKSPEEEEERRKKERKKIIEEEEERKKE